MTLSRGSTPETSTYTVDRGLMHANQIRVPLSLMALLVSKICIATNLSLSASRIFSG